MYIKTAKHICSVQPDADSANQRLLPNVLDEGAATDSEAVWGEIPMSGTTYDAGFRAITWKSMANAVNGLAHLLESELGRGRNFETLAYIGPWDPRYSMMVLAAIKSGYKLFLFSSRNSLTAQMSLFESLECRTIISTSPQPPSVAPLVKALPQLTVVSIPSIDELLSTEYAHFPYGKTWMEARHEPILCLHTSGSTGMPKPLVYSHEFVTVSINVSQLQPPEGYDLLNARITGNRGILLMPLFHISGIHFSTFSTIMSRNTIIFPLPNCPPTGADLGAILDKTTAEWAFIYPFHAEEVAKDSDLLNIVASKLKLLVSCGSSITTRVGNLLAKRVELRNYLGSSECSGFPHLVAKSRRRGDEWAYAQIHPYMNADFQDCGEGFFELVINKSEVHQQWQIPFVLFPHLEQFHTKDIFRAHPTVPGLWLHQGRSDDIIVFLNGKKVNPMGFEASVAEHPDIKSALVFGNQRPEAGILVELDPEKQAKMTVEARAKLVANVQCTVERANSVMPPHARILRSHIIFASADIPFSRAGKGTVQRQLTLKAYEDAIDALYRSTTMHSRS